VIVNREQPVQRVVEALDELVDYLDRVIADKLADPRRRPAIQAGRRAGRDGRAVRSEAARMAVVLLIAGHETTRT